MKEQSKCRCGGNDGPLNGNDQIHHCAAHLVAWDSNGNVHRAARPGRQPNWRDKAEAELTKIMQDQAKRAERAI